MSLVIDDSHIDAVKEYVTTQCKAIEDIVYQYVQTMNSVIETGIMEGATTEALKEFLSQVKSDLEDSNMNPELMGTMTERFCTNFIKKVDKADKQLY